MAETVKAGPTKKFFVNMLTRDIDLKDAVLDLLDNCMDGVMRSLKDRPPADPAKPYAGYWARVSIDKDGFEIVDNCGGIPKDIAIESAFRLGRPGMRDDDIQTIGMYGIGMKRAIFKLGRHAEVVSCTDKEAYQVTIDAGWLTREDDWVLPLEDHARLEHNGTQITVTELYDGISAHFDKTRSNFCDELSAAISQLYTIILNKGFGIFINNQKVDAKDIRIMFPRDLERTSVHPYLFRGAINQVDVLVCVGFFKPPPSVDRILEVEEAEEDYAKAEPEQAGWNIVCNDRLVLHADRSATTGWGTRNIPRYHTQFSSIGGTVIFSSTVSDNLPLRTTKSGINMSSETYLVVLDYMVEGLRKFIDFTNKWKGQVEQTKDFFADTEVRMPTEGADAIPAEKWKPDVRAARYGHGFKYSPDLKRPEVTNLLRKIVFMRNDQQIKAVAELLFGDATVSPRDVGERCFDIQLKRADDE